MGMDMSLEQFSSLGMLVLENDLAKKFNFDYVVGKEKSRKVKFKIAYRY